MVQEEERESCSGTTPSRLGDLNAPNESTSMSTYQSFRLHVLLVPDEFGNDAIPALRHRQRRLD